MLDSLSQLLTISYKSYWKYLPSFTRYEFSSKRERFYFSLGHSLRDHRVRHHRLWKMTRRPGEVQWPAQDHTGYQTEESLAPKLKLVYASFHYSTNMPDVTHNNNAELFVGYFFWTNASEKSMQSKR